MYDTVLIPTDGSERSRRVAAHGIRLAAEYGATVHALHVIDTNALEVSGFGALAEVHDALEAEGESATGAITELAAVYDLDTVAEVREGTPARTILEYADEVDADLISMGTHGRTGLARTILGSVTEQVVRESGVSVLTAHAGDEEPDTDYDAVLVPTDGGPESEAAATVGIDLAARFDADVYALSVVDTSVSRDTAFVSALENNSNDAVQQVEAAGAEREVTVTTEVRQGTPAEIILEYADEADVDFVAMGTHGRTGLDRFVTKSVAERVVRQADSPVLTVRDEQIAADEAE